MRLGISSHYWDDEETLSRVIEPAFSNTRESTPSATNEASLGKSNNEGNSMKTTSHNQFT